MRILAVDDDEIMRELLEATLASGGFEDVTLADGAASAMAEIEAAAEPFDVILLDIQMPGKDGITLCREIRALPDYGRCPILMITAMSDKAYVDRAFAAGATDYVTKPFDVTELITRVRLAGKLAAEMARADAAAAAPELPPVDFAEPLSIEGVDGVIGLIELQNYVLRLSRLRAFRMAAMAVRITGLELVHARMLPGDYRELLTDIGRAVAGAAAGSFEFMAYCGGGVFVMLVPRTSAPDSAELETEIEAALGEDAAVVDEAGRPIALGARCGEAIGPGLFDDHVTMNFMLRAIESALAAARGQRISAPGQKGARRFGALIEPRRAEGS